MNMNLLSKINHEYLSDYEYVMLEAVACVLLF